MKKINILILFIFLISSQTFGQTFFEKIKDNPFKLFGEKEHFFVRFNVINYEDDAADVKFLYGKRQNISLGYVFSDDLILGISSHNSYVDIREDGQEPIHNGLQLYARHIFFEYNIFSHCALDSVKVLNNPILNNIYFGMQRPFGKSGTHDRSENESIRIGFGLRYDLFANFEADVNYYRLLSGKINEGHKKGILNFGVAYSF